MIEDREILKKGVSGVIREKIMNLGKDEYITFSSEQINSLASLRVMASRLSEELGIKISVTDIDSNYYVIRG